MTRHIMENLPAAFAGVIFSALFYYWAIWFLGFASEYDIHLTIQPKGTVECSQSGSISPL